MKSQKGITLIALVITIILMLILAGVTISVSLNGGLFSTAKEATEETQIAQEREQLLVAAMGALGEDGEVDLTKLDNSLPEGFTGSNGEYTSKTGNKFTVAEDGTITLVGESSEEVEEMVTVTFKKGDTRTRLYQLSNVSQMIYSEEITANEISFEVPAGSSWPIWMVVSWASKFEDFPLSEDEFDLWKTNQYSDQFAEEDELPLIVVQCDEVPAINVNGTNIYGPRVEKITITEDIEITCFDD